MKSSVLILGILAVILIAGGAFAFVFMDDIADIAVGMKAMMKTYLRATLPFNLFNVTAQ